MSAWAGFGISITTLASVSVSVSVTHWFAASFSVGALTGDLGPTSSLQALAFSNTSWMIRLPGGSEEEGEEWKAQKPIQFTAKPTQALASPGICWWLPVGLEQFGSCLHWACEAVGEVWEGQESPAPDSSCTG